MKEDSFHLGVKALIKNDQGRILLLQVDPAQLKNYQGEAYWDIPGGRVERGKSVEETLAREIGEELGDRVKLIASAAHSMVLSNIRIPVQPQDVGLILAIYACKVEGIDDIQLSSEHLQYQWFTPADAAQKLEIKYPKEFTDKVREL